MFTPKENKRIVKQFNKVAKVLMQFELVHYQEWSRSVEPIKNALQQPLIVRRNGQLEANFDPRLTTLMKEARNLKLLGFKVCRSWICLGMIVFSSAHNVLLESVQDIPEGAKVVLLLEDKLKQYHIDMKHSLSQYNNLSRVSPVLRALIKPHLADLERVMRPGMTSMTWTSMNIDSFVSAVQSSLSRFEFLINQMKDIVQNRIRANLELVESTQLFDIPEQSFSLDEFASMQAKSIQRCTDLLAAKNVEIERAVDDLIAVRITVLQPQNTTCHQSSYFC